MDESFVNGFLDSFDDSRFPEGFLRTYEPIECLSHNQMGETLLVRERESGAHYVAKCYSDKTLHPGASESDLLKRLRHGGLPSFVGEFENEAMLCVVREYAAGISLDRLAKSSPITEQQAISICVQLCDVLTYLHGQTPPVIHRDIKPQNVIVDENGKIKLIDFGISRVYDETAQADTACFGTKHFAAPEQYGFSQTDGRADIFSLGVLLCWLLTGEVDVGEALGSIRNRRLAGIVKKCTAFAPRDRYATAVAVKDPLTGRTVRRRAFGFLCSAAAVATIMFALLSKGILPGQQMTRVTFDEPLIEQAVRLALSKGEDVEILEEDLLSVTELYVFGDKAAADEEEYAAGPC